MTVRGGLDDALEKLARRNELRRRATQQAPSPPAPALTELVEAVAAVIVRHPELQVALGVEGLAAPTAVRIWLQDGQPQVSMEALVGPPYGPDDDVPQPPGPAAETTTVLVSPAPMSPAPMSPAPAWQDPVGDLPRRSPAGPRSATPEPAAEPPARPPVFPGPEATGQRPGFVDERTVPLRRPPEPLVIPSSDQAAKRLAALLREDPSLLHGSPPQ